LSRMMPPVNETIRKISSETGISEATLYNWRKVSRISGQATPGNGQLSPYTCVKEVFPKNEESHQQIP
jgi:transposase